MFKSETLQYITIAVNWVEDLKVDIFQTEEHI